MRSAIVGCGKIAKVHAEILKEMENIEIVGFADIEESRACDYAQKFGGRTYGNVDAMLKLEMPDVLHICTPHYLHTPMAIAAVEKSVHVFLEKPASISQPEFLSLQKVVSKNNKVSLGICFQNRYNESTKYVSRLIEKEKYGKIKGARAFVTWNRDEEYYSKSAWRGKLETEGGGVLINQAIHTLDLLTYFLGKADWAEATYCNHHLKGMIEVEDTVEAYISFFGIKALFYATTAYCSNSPVILEFACEKGIVRVEGNSVMEIPYNASMIQTSFGNEFLGESYWGNGHESCIKDFYRCLDKGENFFIGIEQIQNTMDLLFKIYHTGRN